jgi:type II secretory pathway component PulF
MVRIAAPRWSVTTRRRSRRRPRLPGPIRPALRSGASRPPRQEAGDDPPRGGARPRGRVSGGRGRSGPAQRRPNGRVATHAPDPDELRLLAQLLEAGVPVLEALSTLAAHARNQRRRRGLAAAAEEVAAGRSVAEVLGRSSAHVRAVLAAGERVGRLAAATESAAELEERLAAVRRRIAAALAYPGFVLLVAVAVVLVLVTTVVPEVEATYRDLGGDLPVLTRAVVAASRWLRRPLTLLGVVALISLVVLRILVAGGSSPGRRRGIPGPIGRSLDVAVAARVVATLLRNGVPLTDALDSASGGSSRRDVGAGLSALADRVARGGRLSDADELATLLPAADRAVLAVGERQGLLAAQWERVAVRRLAAVERSLEVIGTLAEPVLVLVVGGIVGAVVMALYLPSFRVLELL